MLDNLEKNASNIFQTLMYRAKNQDYTLTENEYKILVNNDGDNLRYVPHKFRTKEICEIAVNKSGFNLGYIPSYLQTKELCEIAIKNNRLAIKYVDKKFVSENLFTLALNQPAKSAFDDFNYNCLMYISEKLRTKEICTLALKRDMDNIRFVPHDLLSEWLNI